MEEILNILDKEKVMYHERKSRRCLCGERKSPQD